MYVQQQVRSACVRNITHYGFSFLVEGAFIVAMYMLNDFTVVYVCVCNDGSAHSSGCVVCSLLFEYYYLPCAKYICA